MQDRFKFRVYYKPHNKVYNVICLNCDRQNEIIIEYKGSTAIVEWENCEIIQCTGLKDKNGKLIYEGDIVIQKFDDKEEDYCIPPEKTIVIWQQETAYLGLRTFDKPYYGAHSFSRGSYCEYEVIGNIYENEELLNGNNP